MLNRTEIEETSSASPYPVTTSGTHVDPIVAPVYPEPASENLKLLARKIGSKRPSERDEAQRILDSLPVPMILSLMAYQRKQRKARNIRIAIGITLYVLFFAVVAMWLHRSIPINFWMFMTFGVSGAAFAKVQKSGAMALARRSDLSAVGEIVNALEIRDPEVQQVIRPTLIDLLPQMRMSDTALLNKEQRRVLRQFMDGTLHGREFKRGRNGSDVPLLLAILKALEQVGDASFLPIVSRWASGEHKGADPEVREAAIACQSFLEVLSARQKAGAELLRGSALATARNGTVLLRPASGPIITHSDELLRSAEGVNSTGTDRPEAAENNTDMSDDRAVSLPADRSL